MKTRYFHASPRRHKVGTILTPQKERFLLKNRTHVVFLTTSEVPHYTIFEDALKENWFVYEVEIIGKHWYEPVWDEVTCEQAQIVRFVGNAKGISRRAHKKFRVKPEGKQKGSIVRKNRF